MHLSVKEICPNSTNKQFFTVPEMCLGFFLIVFSCRLVSINMIKYFIINLKTVWNLWSIFRIYTHTSDFNTIDNPQTAGKFWLKTHIKYYAFV